MGKSWKRNAEDRAPDYRRTVADPDPADDGIKFLGDATGDEWPANEAQRETDEYLRFMSRSGAFK